MIYEQVGKLTNDKKSVGTVESLLCRVQFNKKDLLLWPLGGAMLLKQYCTYSPTSPPSFSSFSWIVAKLHGKLTQRFKIDIKGKNKYTSDQS